MTPARHHRAEAIAIIKRDGYAADHSLGVGQLGHAITRQINANLMPRGSQCPGKSSDHVRQTSGLGKRNAFRRHKANMHQDDLQEVYPVRGRGYYDTCRLTVTVAGAISRMRG
jgi:hypothetical protein